MITQLKAKGESLNLAHKILISKIPENAKLILETC